MKGALGRPAFIVGLGMLLFAGQPCAATEWDPVEALSEFTAQTGTDARTESERRDDRSGAPRDVISLVPSERASRQRDSQQRTRMQSPDDGMTVPSHLVNVLLGYQDSPGDRRDKTWTTIWIVQRWTFEPLLPLPEAADAVCRYCSRALFKLVPLAFPYPQVSALAGPGFVAGGIGYAEIDANPDSMTGPAVTFTPLGLPAAGSARQRTSGHPPPPFYGIASAAPVGLYMDPAAYANAFDPAAMPILRDAEVDSTTAAEVLLDAVINTGAMNEEPYGGCPGSAWTRPGCDASQDSVTFNPPPHAATAETESTVETTRVVPEPGTLVLLGLGLLALGTSSPRVARQVPAD